MIVKNRRKLGMDFAHPQNHSSGDDAFEDDLADKPHPQ